MTLATPVYAESHSMAKHYDAMLVGARALGNLPERTRCRNSSATARVHEDKAQQVCQKILRCLDIEGVISGGLVGVPRMCRRFLKFAYVVVRVCMGKVYSLLVRGVSRSKTLNPLMLAQSGWMLYYNSK